MKIIATIEARLGSKRLKEKLLLPIGNLKLIEFLILRLKKSKLIDQIVLATTNKKIDKKLVNIAKKKILIISLAVKRMFWKGSIKLQKNSMQKL